MENKHIKILTLTAIIAMANLSGCGKNLSYDEYITEAKSQVEQGDHASAILSLKNAVRMEPKNIEARYELGTVYLNEGDLFSAEKELDKALELGADFPGLLPKIAKVKMLLSKYKEVYELADNSGGYNDEQYVMILTYAGLSAISDGKMDMAEDYIGQASMLSEDSLYSQVGNAWLNFSSEKFEDVSNTLNKILSQSNEFSEALLLSGHLHQAQFQFDKATEMYSAYLKLHPRHFQVKLYLINSLLGAGDFENAEKHLSLLNQLYKDHPIVNLYNAQVDYNHKKYAEAKIHAEKAINITPSLHMGQLIAGMSAFKLGELELAYSHLSKIGQFLPANHEVKKLLAMLQLQLGFDGEAELSFEDMNATNINDINIINAASKAFAKKGQNDVAERLLKKVVTANPENSDLALQYSALKLSQGDESQMPLLEKLAQSSDKSVGASLILATHYINKKDYAGAFKVAEQLKSTEKQKIKGTLLEGFIYVNKGDGKQAEEIFNQVLLIDEGNIPANYYLGEFAFNNKDWKKAKSYFTTILAFEPTHKASVARLSYINLQLNKINETISYLEGLLNKYPNNEDIMVDLSINLSADGKTKEAIKLLETSNIKEKSPRYIRGLAKLYVSDLKLKEAKELYQFLAEFKPVDHNIWVEYAAVEEQLGNVELALTVINDALNVVDTKEQLLLLKANMLLMLKRDDSAETIISELYSNYPNNPNVLYLQAQLNLTKNKVKYAAEQFSKLYENKPSNELALSWAKALIKSGEDNKAIEILEKHEASFPLTDPNKALLAELLLKNNPQKSEKLYLSLEDKYPNNVAVLNNLAWAIYNQSNFDEALLYAEKAYKNKRSSTTIDTLVTVLIANNKSNKVLELLKNAENKTFINEKLQLTLVETYLLLGQRSEAKSELDKLTSIPENLKAQYNTLMKQF
ncbi:XrtA/PEP-CTERM system TPR-repeat protein PrsT [Pseudocolwellia agarivorans]|uniref:XrtA/PEP-CTERM system TPR-repeat protein PrsT n=1 Tax=Pseudocolwellia agarivorans TaxID=1911682 RepID=UPI0009850C8D|nr:XrtA/PEP-CTERM system TPR-repeat protein PrsT [Pseudocolwellia agarivorans]